MRSLRVFVICVIRVFTFCVYLSWELLQFRKFQLVFGYLVISRRALAREGDYEMMSVCACVRACVRALVSHADFSKTTTATDFL